MNKAQQLEEARWTWLAVDEREWESDGRDHVELPEDYLEKAKEIYSFQASHPVDEKLRGES